MTDEQPTPPPLDLDAIERSYRRGETYLEDFPDLLAEVRRLRADLAAARAARDHLRGEVEWALAQHSSPTLAPADCRVCQRLRAALGDWP